MAEQISYWFYTFLLYYVEASPRTKKTKTRINRIKNMLLEDDELCQWYTEYFQQAMYYYKERLRVLAGDRTWIST